MASPIEVRFKAGDIGAWSVTRIAPVIGASLSPAQRLEVVEGHTAERTTGDGDSRAVWTLRGFTSNERYVERSERVALTEVQEPLGRARASRAALIPIRKSDAWWDLTQDERRVIFDQRSRHIAVGLEYLPAVARRLHHARDLGEEFDFVTWFEFAPETSDAFEEMVARLRSTEEWSYVEREVDIRLAR
jgi:hypothetical protein